MKQSFYMLTVVAIIAAFFVGYASNLSLQPVAQPTPSAQLEITVIPTSAPATTPTVQAQIQQQANIVKLKLPAVDKDGNGALADLIIEVRPGQGRVFIGFEDSPLINADTQTSLRIALDVAKRIAGEFKDVDVSYTFAAESDVVGGKSAGAGAALATIAALKKDKLNQSILITGSIEPDGAIGPVGMITAKAQAAKKAGYATLLVPPGESVQNKVAEQCKENRTSNSYTKKCYSTVNKVSVGEEVGMNIIEVKNIGEAYAYFVR